MNCWRYSVQFLRLFRNFVSNIIFNIKLSMVMDDIDFNNMNNALSDDDLNPSSGLCEESSIQQDSEQELGSAIFSPYVVDHTNPYMVDKFIDSTNPFSPDYIDSTNPMSTQHIDTSNPFSSDYIPDDNF